jgi:3-hydroxyisobutyrate dehydrogenase
MPMTVRCRASVIKGERERQGADGQPTEKLGYLGLGLMGLPMAGRLLNAGHDVTVWNRSAEKTATLVKAGAPNPQ